MNLKDLKDKYLQPVVEWWKSQETKRRRQILIMAGLLLVVIVALVIFLNYQPYVTLFSNLSSAESAEILARLQEMGINAKMQSSGTILVPKDQEAALKMNLAVEGYPKSGFSYDIYISNVDAMTTDSDRRAYRLFQLQERIQQAVRTINGVTDAVVTISENTAGSSVLTSTQTAPSASVLVTMLGGEDLTAAQVNGIRQLVAKSVQGMKKEDVAVIDSTSGAEMGGSADSVSGRATDKMEIEKQIDATVETKVRDILRPLLGEGYATVVATSRVSTDAGVVQSTTYTPMNEDGTTGVTYRENH
jgi:flagellar M-ring protein FliF